jgi:hypothetical protein
MTPRIRSFSGAALMLVIIPMFAGLLACMPVPIGDPERSRIDPELNGVWAFVEDGTDSGYYLFRPYDKRTWLVIGIEDGGMDSEKIGVYKAWLKKLGGEQFMTWEQAGAFNDDGSFQSQYWFVFRLEKNDSNNVSLHMLDYDFDGFEALPDPDDYEGDYVGDMRRKFERVISKNVDNEALYGDAIVLRRLGDDELAEVSERFTKVIAFD